MSKPKKHPYALTDIPADIFEILIDKQAEIKKKCQCQISLEFVIYKFIRANKDLIID